MGEPNYDCLQIYNSFQTNKPYSENAGMHLLPREQVLNEAGVYSVGCAVISG